MPNQVVCPHCRAIITKKDVCGYCGVALPAQSTFITNPDAETTQDADSVLIELAEFATLKRPESSPSVISGIMLLLFAIPWMTCILSGFFFLGAKFISNYTTQFRLCSGGVTAPGVVTHLDIDDSGDSTSYNISYRFKAPLNGTYTVFEKTGTISEVVYKTLETGGKVDVVYLQSDPATSAVKADLGPPDIKMILIFLAFELFGIAVGVFMLLSGLRMGRTFLLLRSEGAITKAVIFDRWVESGSDSSSYNVAFAFRVPGFDKKLVTNAVQSYWAYKKMKIGDIVVVRYLPSDPKISQLKDFN